MRGGINMTPMEEFYEKQAGTIIKRLEKRNIAGYYCADRASAAEKVLSIIRDGATVSWGGSMTLKECGIIDALKQAPVTLLDRAAAKSQEEVQAIYRQAFSADYYLMSSNAITLDGQLVNIDGNGNRVAALTFGPEHVILVVGMNKVTKTVEEALNRVHNVAAPPNAVRLGSNTPCGSTGVCADCLSPQCLCAQVLVTRYSRTPGRIQVILVGETLGF